MPLILPNVIPDMTKAVEKRVFMPDYIKNSFLTYYQKILI